MKKGLLFAIITTVLLVGCNGRPNVTATPTPTSVPTSTPTLTPSPVAMFNLTVKVASGNGKVKIENITDYSDEAFASFPITDEKIKTGGVTIFSNAQKDSCFFGWFSDADCKKSIDYNPIYTYKNISNGDSDKTIYAKFVTCTPIPTATPVPSEIPVDWSDIRQYADDDHGTIKAELRKTLTDNNVFKKPALDVTFDIPFNKTYKNQVAKKINYELQKAYQMLQDKDYYPDMSGIRVVARKGTLEKKTIEFHTTFFDEGILSVTFLVNYKMFIQSYSNPADGIWYKYHYIYPLTFNLESGETVKLADLFYNDVDFAEVLRQAVTHQIYNNNLPNGILNENGSLEPFDDAILQDSVGKINNEQRFFINSDNAIVLVIEGSQQIDYYNNYQIIDYEFPIMQDTFFKYGTLHITHLEGEHLSDDCSDLHDIIVKDTSAEYLSNTYNYLDPYRMGDGPLIKDGLHIISDKIQIGQYTKVFSNDFEDGRPFSDYELRSMLSDKNSQLYKNIAVLKTDEKNERVWLSQKIIGKYIVISTYSKNNGSSLVLDRTYTLFDKETNQPLDVSLHWDRINDFFKEGVDANEFLKAEYKKKLVSSNLFTEEQIDDFIDSLHMNAITFEIYDYSSEFCLWVSVEKESWPQEPFTVENTGWGYGMYCDYSRVKVPISDISKLIFY